MQLQTFLKILDILEQNLSQNTPAHILKNSYKRNPYTILMVTLLSLRSKDEKTATIAKQLFNDIQTPSELLQQFSQDKLEDIIKPIGFQKQKAKTLLEVSKVLIEKYNAQVPNDKEKLLSIKGIGEKTANIVLNNAFGIGSIAVDTHVHRLTNLWGIVDTKSFDESSKILNDIIPNSYKSKLNFTLVSFGQTICTVNNPKCEICSIKEYCGMKIFNNSTI